MKQVLTILLVLLLCGCNSRISNDGFTVSKESIKKLIDAGYSNKAATLISTYSRSTREYLTNNYSEEYEKIIINNFSEEKVQDFLSSNLDADTYIYVAKNNIKGSELDTIKEFAKDKYYMFKNLNLYFEFKKNFKDNRLLIEYVNTKAYKKGYIEYDNSDTTKENFIIASKMYYLGDYVPTEIVKVDDKYCYYDNVTMKAVAYEAYSRMADDARKEGLYFYISSAYRSYKYQESLYLGYLTDDSQRSVDTYSSRPGFSDHQVGLSCDIRTTDCAFEEFSNTKEAKWLLNNAYKYGFILRYPKDKEQITGYIYETWHYRYVGEEAAYIIYNDNITYDEYYSYYIED